MGLTFTVLLIAAARKDAGDRQRAIRAVRLLVRECTARRHAELLCKLRTHEYLIRLRIVRPVTIDVPPRLHELHARGVDLIRRQRERMLEPRAEERNGLTVRKRHIRRQ